MTNLAKYSAITFEYSLLDALPVTGEVSAACYSEVLGIGVDSAIGILVLFELFETAYVALK